MTLPRTSPASLSRRGFLGLGAAAAAASTLAACASAPRSATTGGAGNKLQIVMTPFAGADLGVMPREFAKDYMDRHPNVEIKIDDTLNLAKQTAAYQADPKAPLNNLVFSNGGGTAGGKATGMYAKIDYSLIPNTAGLDETFVEKDHVGVVFGADQQGIVYNTEKYPDGFGDWAQLWDPSQLGTLCFFTVPWWAIGMASKLNGGSWEDMDPGFAVWKEHAKNIRTIVSANPQFLNVLSTAEAPLTSHYFGTSNAWKNTGAPIGYRAPEQGVFFDPVGVNINSGSSEDQVEVMHDMINEMLSPTWNQRWVDTSIQIPAVEATQLTEKLQALKPIADRSSQTFVDVDWAVVGKNLAAWTERWNTEIVPNI